jgi:hypothetical protein
MYVQIALHVCLKHLDLSLPTWPEMLFVRIEISGIRTRVVCSCGGRDVQCATLVLYLCSYIHTYLYF